MSPGTAAWLANVRAEAEAPGAVMTIVSGTVRGAPRRAAIFPTDVVGKTDDELFALIRARLAEPRTVSPRTA